jgi:hypothetical protein
MENFAEFWKELTMKLKEKIQIRNWTAYNDFIGDDFYAYYDDKRDIIIAELPSDDAMLQSIPKDEFAFMYEHWQDYVSGNIKRSELRNESRFSKYVISILHQFKS